MASDPKKDYILDEIRSVESSIKEVSHKVSELDKTVAQYKLSFDHHVQVDEQMYVELKRMNDILAQNTKSLETHIKRTDLLEQAVLKMDIKLKDIEVKEIEKRAIKKWLKDNSKFIGKICVAIGSLVTALMAAPSVISWLSSLLH